MFEELKSNIYQTPEKVPQLWRETFLIRSRLSVYFTLLGAVLKFRPLAIKGLYDSQTWSTSSLYFMHRMERCGARFRISGLDNLRNLTGPVVFVANHMSTLETMILPGLINPFSECVFVAKESLVKGKLWGPVMRSRHPILVNRKDPRADLDAVMTQGCENLANGRSVVIFPQGTRTDNFTREGFNSLGIKLASKAGVSVVPIALKTDYWGNSPVFRGFGPVRRSREVLFDFGTPIPVSGRGKAEHEMVLDFIESRLKAWGKIPPK